MICRKSEKSAEHFFRCEDTSCGLEKPKRSSYFRCESRHIRQGTIRYYTNTTYSLLRLPSYLVTRLLVSMRPHRLKSVDGLGRARWRKTSAPREARTLDLGLIRTTLYRLSYGSDYHREFLPLQNLYMHACECLQASFFFVCQLGICFLCRLPFLFVSPKDPRCTVSCTAT